MNHKVGDYVRICVRSHPHYGRVGTIVAPATGSPASVGLDWEVNLEDGGIGETECFAADNEVQEWPNAAR